MQNAKFSKMKKKKNYSTATHFRLPRKIRKHPISGTRAKLNINIVINKYSHLADIIFYYPIILFIIPYLWGILTRQHK